MAEIIGIRFKREGKQYYFDPQGLTVKPGMGVILETSWGIEYAECVKGNTQIPDKELVAPLRPILRIATPEDEETVRRNREKEAETFRVCQEKINEHQLEMKLVEVEYSFEGNKILFFFTSEGRVDFRGLVKDLAAIFHTRIELRQIGVRDEAKMLGGLGICGRPFCCASFLRDFQPVSIKMAKTQNLSLNPTKISGTCGRLMCCLKYEQDAYEDLLKHAPKVDSFVETPDGVGTITSVNTLREKVRVRLDNAPDTLKIYHNTEIRVISVGKGKRPEGYIPPSAEELSKLRRVKEEVVAEANRPDAGLLSGTLRRQLLGAAPHLEEAPEAPIPAAPPAHKDEAQRRRNQNRSRNNRGRGGEGNKAHSKAETPTPPPGVPHQDPRRGKRGPALPEGDKREKPLPKEKQPAPKEKTHPPAAAPEAGGEKKVRGPYWRRRPAKKRKEGGAGQ